MINVTSGGNNVKINMVMIYLKIIIIKLILTLFPPEVTLIIYSINCINVSKSGSSQRKLFKA